MDDKQTVFYGPVPFKNTVVSGFLFFVVHMYQNFKKTNKPKKPVKFQ